MRKSKRKIHRKLQKKSPKKAQRKSPKKRILKQKFLIVGNWKMNPATLDEAKTLVRSVTRSGRKSPQVAIVLCPPFPYLSLIKSEKNIRRGAQDCFYEERGAYTGSVSPIMLKAMDVAYVIVGHSERRAAGETNEVVAKKLRAAMRVNVSPILCIGETHRDTEGNYLAMIREQLKESLVYTERTMLSQLVIAYEPVWAIGGRVAVASHDIHQAVIFIKKVLTELYTPELVKSIKILYGGSSNAENALDILSRGEVAGLLVGGASLKAADFGEMIRIADRLT
jgi:triosephosphate isomerase (TIM)